MAYLTNSIANNSSGKIGKTIYYKMFGKQFARNAPKPVSVPPTQAQLDQRIGVFKRAAYFIQSLAFLITFIFPMTVTGKSKRAFFAKQIFPAFGGTQAAPTTDLTQAIVGNGSIPRQGPIAFSAASGVQVKFEWLTTPAVPIELGTDEVDFILFSENFTPFYVATTKTRSDGTYTATLPDVFIGHQLTCTDVIFRSADGLNCSRFALDCGLPAITILA